MTPLCELSRKHGCDKGGEYHPYGDVTRWSHCYTPVYWELFKDLRDKPITLLEIGVSEGYSINMWHEFFPHGSIIGWDIRNDYWTEAVCSSRIHLQKVDQSDPGQMFKVWTELGKPEFDIIIDDGSHRFEDQVITLGIMLPHLKPNGIYVVEDITNSIARFLPPTCKFDFYHWPLRPGQDPAMGDMLQVVRCA